jgi:hypothetical protein
VRALPPVRRAIEDARHPRKLKREATMAAARRTKRVLNCIPSKGTETDWRFEHAEQAGLLAGAPAIPAKPGSTALEAG